MSAAKSRISHVELVALIARDVGWDRAVQAVDIVTVRLGLRGNNYSASVADRILEELAARDSDIGTAARVLRTTRFQDARRSRSTRPPPAASRPPPARHVSGTVPVGTRTPSQPALPAAVAEPRVRRIDLAALLEHAYPSGHEAADAVARAAHAAGILGGEMSREDAVRLLEHLAQDPGSAGAAAARFAMARFHLGPLAPPRSRPRER